MGFLDLQCLRQEVRVDHPLARGHASYAAGEGSSGRILLDEAAYVRSKGAQEVPRRAEPGEDERLAFGELVVQELRDAQPVKTRKIDVENRNIRSRSQGGAEYLVAPFQLSDDLQVVLARKESNERLADHLHVLSDQDADHWTVSETSTRRLEPTAAKSLGSEMARQ